MQRWIEDLLTDSYPPEKAKFKSPLILVHGLWTGSWCWRAWATHFSNLGWECLAMNMRGRFEERPVEALNRLSVDDCVRDLARVIRSCDFPPVLLAHSLGSLIALKAAEQNDLSALILASPLPPHNFNIDATRRHRLLRLKYLPLVFFRRPFRLEEKDFRRILSASLPASVQAEIFAGTVPDSPDLIREFFRPRVVVEPRAPRCPTLIVAGGQDPISPAATSREIALRLGADIEAYPAQGHWLIEADGETVVRAIHRWLVRKLGDEILLAEFL